MDDPGSRIRTCKTCWADKKERNSLLFISSSSSGSVVVSQEEQSLLQQMDCSICSAMPYILRPPRNTICGACYEGARSIITLTNKHDNEKPADKPSNNLVSSLNSAKGFTNALKWVKEMKEMEDELNDKISFLAGFISAFRDQIHTDIQLKPGNNGPSIPAHKALLAARSDIFRNILDSDSCKAPANETITLPELNHDELESLLEFLYSGHLPKEKVEKHVYSLSIAADKYEIPFLQKFCEHQMLGSLNSCNALDILEISDTCSNQSLKETALNYIVRNMEDVVFSARFDAFALKNPHLTYSENMVIRVGVWNWKDNHTSADQQSSKLSLKIPESQPQVLTQAIDRT